VFYWQKGVFFSNSNGQLNELNVVNTPFVDPTTFQVTQFTDAVQNPRTRTNFSQRFDYQVTAGNTLRALSYWRNNEQNDSTSPCIFSLPSFGYNSLETEHTFQVSDTQTLSARTIKNAVSVRP